MNNLNNYELWTDGSCDVHNPGHPGGWAALLVKKGEKEGTLVTGGYPDTTSNRMELTAILKGLRTVVDDGDAVGSVTVFSDSQYAINILTGRYHAWENHDLVDAIRAILDYEVPIVGDFFVEFRWVRGHNGNELNELVNKAAYDAMKEAFK